MFQPIRLNKFLAERLGISRREADEAIEKGRVTVDGKKAALGARVDESNKICYNNKNVPFETLFLYIAFNKPVGYVCSRRAQGSAPTLYELLPKKYQHLKTVGRLDKDSSGLILLTNDGNFAFQMTHPKFHKEKIYEIELDHPLEPLHQQMISDFGIMLDDGPSKFTVIKNEPTGRQSAHKQTTPAHPQPTPSHSESSESSTPTYTAILTEGRNRQIRRTFAALGYKVTKLHRTKFGKYQLNSLPPGKCDIIKV